jgi:hypothetical protein
MLFGEQPSDIYQISIGPRHAEVRENPDRQDNLDYDNDRGAKDIPE